MDFEQICLHAESFMFSEYSPHMFLHIYLLFLALVDKFFDGKDKRLWGLS